MVDIEKIKEEYGKACDDYYNHGSTQYDLGRMEGLSTALLYCGLNVTEIYNIKEPFVD
jgi:hypothetical protein